jgi:transposase
VLGGSQYAYVEALESQRKGCVIAGIERALVYFGGAPQALVPDNLKAAVLKASHYEPLLSLNSQQDLLRFGCHRTGKRYKDAFVPLYRTRVALSYLLEVNHLIQLLLQKMLTHQNSG